ncbi:MAG: hypothetical protein CENE_02177 [Candidatus Celerinatantimonas neptuna]|nr:MAG: hypothetical protein CENE_02177 [Candidatus Celerinatantimonas neptuna]
MGLPLFVFHQNSQYLSENFSDNIINMNERSGFTLLEVMIAAALLSMCIIFSSQFLSYSRWMLLDAARRQHANLVLESVAAIAQADHREWLKNAPWHYQLSDAESQITSEQNGNLAQDFRTIKMLFRSQKQNGLFALIAPRLEISLVSHGLLTLKVYWQSHDHLKEIVRRIQLQP